MAQTLTQSFVKLNCKGIVLGLIFASIPALAADMQVEGLKFVEAKNYVKALDCFHAALQEQPNNWQIWQSMGSCQMQLGRNDAAVNDLQRSIEIGGLHASQCTIMAAALEGLGQPKQALSWLKLACKVEPFRLGDPGMQAAIRRLEDPLVNPGGSPDSPDYLSGLVDINRWRKQDMPLKVYVRKNVQLPGFYDSFLGVVREAMQKWCQATGNAVSYKLVQDKESASLIWDYTDRPELCTSNHEPGLEGANEMRLRMEDRTASAGNITVVVKKGPNAPSFRDRQLILTTCLHEAGHALGIHGHSPNPHDVMFLAATPEAKPKLSQRDKNTIRVMYQAGGK
ncbi:MAG: matrixin family metalloprotease [Cyanobacteria bacterium SZAS TMP-1]|nr:matrixin family metalloprotease [Cyanobacteria bacterium SZAS TMP-1]